MMQWNQRRPTVWESFRHYVRYWILGTERCVTPAWIWVPR